MDHVPVARRTDTCHLDARSGPAARVWGFSAAGGPERWGRCWPFLRSSCYLNISINIKRPQTVIFRTCGPILRRRGADRTSGRFLDVPRSCSESRNRIPNRFGSTSFQVNTSFRFQNSTHYRLRPQSAVRRRVYARGGMSGRLSGQLIGTCAHRHAETATKRHHKALAHSDAKGFAWRKPAC